MFRRERQCRQLDRRCRVAQLIADRNAKLMPQLLVRSVDLAQRFKQRRQVLDRWMLCERLGRGPAHERIAVGQRRSNKLHLPRRPLGRFAQRFPEALPPDILTELVAIAREVLADYTGNPRVAAFWASRLERFACWFGDTERARRSGIARVVAEASGKPVGSTRSAPPPLDRML